MLAGLLTLVLIYNDSCCLFQSKKHQNISVMCRIKGGTIRKWVCAVVACSCFDRILCQAVRVFECETFFLNNIGLFVFIYMKSSPTRLIYHISTNALA